jgi:16S rRNA (adenine1518-N6/adenine1519-N6)-dimethyltransferase
VIALEADTRALESLEVTFASEIAAGQLTLHHHDVRHLKPDDFGLTDGGYKVVANIPYYLSGFLFRTLLESDCQPNTLVFLVQKEVAARIARDKKESLLSLSVKAFGDPTYICTISRGHFTPPPKIDSAIIAVTDISRARLGNLPTEAFFELIHLGFGQKRKQLIGNLSQKYERWELESILASLNLQLTVRAEDVPLETWIKLAALLQSTDASPV